MAKSEVEAKKLVLEKFYEWIKVFGKKQLEQMPKRKACDHVIICAKKRESIPIVERRERGG